MSAGTKARILETALALFNAEGFSTCSAVDIASALQMSPGHLHYHFKGKADLAAALMEAHAGELQVIRTVAARACGAPGADLQTMWTHVHILVEEAFDARFAYREAHGVARFDPRLAALMRRLFVTQEGAARDMLEGLTASGALVAGPETLDGLVSQVALGLAFQSVRLEFDAPETTPPRALVARTAALVMLPVTGFAATARP